MADRAYHPESRYIVLLGGALGVSLQCRGAQEVRQASYRSRLAIRATCRVRSDSLVMCSIFPHQTWL